MTNIIQLNIGLNDSDGLPLNVHTACLACESYGFSILASRVFESPAGGENVLVISAQYRGSDLTASIYALAVNLRQDCIAVYHGGGRGELIGPNAEKWGAFNPAYFLNRSGKSLVEQARGCPLGGPSKNESQKLKTARWVHRFYHQICENANEKDLIFRLARELEIDL